MAGDEAVPDEFGQAVQWMEAFIYVKNSLLASPRPAWIQATLYILTGLFGRVGLQTNIKNSWDGVSILLHFQRTLGGDAHKADDARGSIIL